ncbi:type VII secretion-associated serine protease mycosin [Streptomyces sp. MUM 178J]|uniref:type VII secretion-associated serine protease mycosin n=1 Tax=Streptomyces sp. MUM 178J TaxID=2791991 RepID=UPI0027E35A30|nr:type VII secretion-associated serine protease mycosin [Streptomyces sp. MUM 178J]WRQ83326.1 type VII secretion-associated serine protease mycosin [Streptomyces sp. MUM 178J]
MLAGVAATPAHAESIRSQQWHLDAMGAEDIWKISTGKGVTVAVIDSGVDADNGDLRGQVLEGLDLAPKSDGDERTDYDGHGTAMAGLIAGTGKSGNGDGAFGLAPGSKILPIRMPESGNLANQAEGNEQFNTYAPKAIRYAADNGAEVINVSMAVREGSPQLTEAVKYALNKGALLFAGTGNDGHNGLVYPAATPGVVGVSALDQKLQKTKESQYGPQVDVSAPGVDMVHACGDSESGLCKSRGTSDATAIASATAALIWSKHPEWTNNQVLRVILNTVSGPTSGSERNDHIGYGAVRPLRALQEPGDPGPADEYPLPDLAVAQSPSPAPDPSKPTAGSGPDDGKTEAAAPTADGSGGSNTGLWIGLGVGAAVIIGAAVAVSLARRRQR